MTEYVETLEDIRLKYDKGYIRYGDGVAHICKINNGETGMIAFLQVPKKSGWEDIGHIPFNQLDVSCIERGAINLGSSVVVATLKSPINGTDKYKRCIHGGNTHIHDPFKYERKLLYSQPVKFNDPVVLDYLAKEMYFSAEEALATVTSFKRIASAFTKEYYFGIKYSTNSVMLFKNTYIIGRVADGVVLLKPAAHPYAEELEELGVIVKKVAK